MVLKCSSPGGFEVLNESVVLAEKNAVHERVLEALFRLPEAERF